MVKTYLPHTDNNSPKQIESLVFILFKKALLLGKNKSAVGDQVIHLVFLFPLQWMKAVE